MYKDNRTISGKGLLSQKTGGGYQFRPVTMRFNAAGKPPDTAVNLDQDKTQYTSYQKSQYELQQQSQAAAQNQPKGGKVICGQYHALGYLSDKLYQADADYGDELARTDPQFILWYWSWAVPFVDNVLHGKTKISLLAIWLGWPICKAWAQEMAYQRDVVDKGSLVGRAMAAVGRFAYQLSSYSRLKHA